MFKLIFRLFNSSKEMSRCERGAAYVYVAILLPAFIGFIGLGVDIGLWQVTKRDTQMIADAAAVAGALEAERFREFPDDADTNAAALTAATANGYDAGSGIDAIQINDPPGSGPYQGQSGTVEVIMAREAPIFFSTLFRTEPVLVRSRAVAVAGTGDACIWALSPDDRSALRVAGTADVDINCGVRVNSNDPDALNVVGGGCLDATGAQVFGGYNGECINPTPIEGVPPQSDPLATMPEPDFGACDQNSPVNHNGANDLTLTPGVYCGNLRLNGSGPVTFEPGLYVLDGASLTIGAQANVTGNGVMFYINPNQTSDNVNIQAGATVSLTAPTSSCDELVWPECLIYESILFFESRTAPGNIVHNLAGGASMDLNGVLYFPNTDVQFAGGSETDNSNVSIVAYTVDFVGTSDVAETVIVDGEEQFIFPFSRYLIRVQLVE